MSWVVDSFLGLAQAISSFISQGIETLIDCLFYPVQRIFYWLSTITDIIINSIMGIINSFWDMFTILYNFISGIISDMLPYTFTVIILLGLTIMFLLRLHKFLKEVSIMGNKV